MRPEDLPTNEDFGDYGWANVLEMPNDFGYGPEISTRATEVLTHTDRGQITLERMETVEAFYADSPEGYGSCNVFALVRLADGWATLIAWCDTTGWDCQSGGDWRWAATRDEAIRNGLGNEERKALGLSIEGGATS